MGQGLRHRGDGADAVARVRPARPPPGRLSVFAFNERARRAYEKAGFQVEGRLREAIARDGRWWDEIQMGILREEWVELRQRRADQRWRRAVPEAVSGGAEARAAR